MAGSKIRSVVFLSVMLCTSFLGLAQTTNCSQVSQFYSKDSINIITFGASTVAGIGGSGFQGFLKNHIEYCYTGKYINIENFGIPGETTKQGLARIDAAIKDKTGFILILMGANDALSINDNKSRLNDTESNMRLIIQKCLAAKLVVILGTIQNLDDRNSKVYQKANVIVGKINAIYRRLAAEYHIQLAEINQTLGRDFKLYSDFVHPNDKGYMLISYVWFDALNKSIEANFLTLYISQNFPNPAGYTSKITYTVPSSGKILLSLYDINGHFIKYLINEYENAGIYTREFDFSSVNNGLYIYVFQAEGKKRIVKMLVSK